MAKLHFCLLAFLLLTLLVHTQSNISEHDQKSWMKTRNKGDIPPNIRKCKNVQCDQGQQCFHGRCIKIDQECVNVHCQRGQRCKKGQCIKQVHVPKKIICRPIGFKSQKQRCNQDLLQSCRQQNITQHVCGFNRLNRKFLDYSSPCQACTDNASQIHFYYPVTCEAAPRICTQDEQCLNGVCSGLFSDPTFKNYRTCNIDADCKEDENCAGHKCINKRDLYNFLTSMAETKAFQVKIS